MSAAGHALAFTSFAVFGVIVVWAGLHWTTGALAALLGYALFVALVYWVTAPADALCNVRLR